MRAILTQAGLHKALLGKEEMPSSLTDAQKLEIDEKALSTIQLCLSNEVLREVINQKTAKALWDKLESLYITKNLTTKLIAKHRLYTLSMAEGASLNAHLDEFTSILMDLANMEIMYDDEDQALMLLRSLPPSYKNFRETLIYSNKSLKLEEVKAALYSKELFDKELSGSHMDDQTGVLVVRGKHTAGNSSNSCSSRSKSKSRHGNLTCHYCKKKGHIKADCFKLQNKNKGGNQKDDDSTEANLVTDKVDFDVYAVCEDSASTNQEWILDSACPFHVCLNRDWFSSYDPVDRGVAWMGNGHPCKVVGIGTIKIKMHDGVIRTLSEVRHVPEMKRNLVSLTALDEKGCSYSGGGGALKVSKGALVVMKAKQIGRLYVLQGSTVPGLATVHLMSDVAGDPSSSGTVSCDDPTKRFGVMQEEVESPSESKFKQCLDLIGISD